VNVQSSIVALAAVALLPALPAQAVPHPFQTRTVQVDSGYLNNASAAEHVVFREFVRFPEAGWLRLRFQHTNLPAGSRLRLTAAADGAVQWFDAHSLADYQGYSACFNGGEVTVELLAGPNSRGNRARVVTVDVGDFAPMPESLCGADDRKPSNDPRQGRQYPTGCTAWLANEFTVLTAGHCVGSSPQQIHFNVPFSTSSGKLVLPHPDDQYPYEMGTLRRLAGGIGKDWAVVRAVKNSNTGLYPGQAQGSWYELGAVPTTTSGQIIRITGYGTTSSPISPTWNQVQKTHADQLTLIASDYLRSIPDTTGGNSGSPVIHENTGKVVGIHTHAGCSTGGNHGTRIDRRDLQSAFQSISTSKILGRASSIGQGCQGLELEALPLPTIGQTTFVRVRCPNQFNQPAAVAYGFSKRVWNGTLLPAPIPGSPGCSVFTSLDVTVSGSSGVGIFSHALAVPNLPSLVGGQVFAQGLVLTVQGSFASSNSLEMTVGRDV
jgi:V8-like Glu-specific endopeptidase